MDEAGTPFCITIDSQTREDDTVTVRDRDTMKQVRVKASELKSMIRDSILSYTRPVTEDMLEETYVE